MINPFFKIPDISTSYVDYLHTQPSSPSTPLPTATPPSAIRNPTSPTHPPLNASETTPLLATRFKPRPRSRSLCDHDHRDSATLLPLILLNSPRLSRGGLPLSGMVWGRDISCFCPPVFMQPGEQQDFLRRFDDGSAEVRDVPKQIEIKPEIGRKRQIVGICVRTFRSSCPKFLPTCYIIGASTGHHDPFTRYWLDTCSNFGFRF